MAANVSFNPATFDELIENHGYNATWYQAIACECIKDGQPDPLCPMCQGQGFRHIRFKDIKVVATSFGGNEDLRVQGLSEPGQVYVTPQRDCIMGYHDRLEFFETECKYSQPLTLKKGITSATYRPIKQVEFVMSGNRLFDEDVDFVISKDKHHLEWINEETKPKDGQVISCLYLTSPVYQISDMSHELRSIRFNKGVISPITQDMPKQYVAKRLDFVYGQTVNVKKDESEKDKWNEEDFTYE